MCSDEINTGDPTKRFYTFDSLPNVLVPGSSNIVIRTDDTAGDSTNNLKYEVHFLPSIQPTTVVGEDTSSSPTPSQQQQQAAVIDDKRIIVKNRKRPAHMQPQQDTQRFPCPRCGRDYSQSKNMRRHYRLECGQTPRFPCDFCHLRFKRNNQLKNHVMIKHCSSLNVQYQNQCRILTIGDKKKNNQNE